MCSAAETRTCRTSACSRHRSGGWCSTSTISTRVPGPWEWDVKRLAVSMLIAARDNGYRTKDEERIVLDTVARYRTAMAEFAGMKNLDVRYSRLEIESAPQELAPQFQKKTVKRTTKAAREGSIKDSMTAFSKLTQPVNGNLSIADQSPLFVTIEQLRRPMSAS